MVNLPKFPDSLYEDYNNGASSSKTAPFNTMGAASSFSTAERAQIDQLVMLLNQPQTRSEAIVQLNKLFKSFEERKMELGFIIWNSYGTQFSLLQELKSAYRLLSPPRLGMAETKKICNALVLIQCIAFHPEVRIKLINAQMIVYFYHYVNTSEKHPSQYDYLRLSGLGVIGALVKDTCPDTPEIVRYLLEIETFPLCLRCMDVGGDLTKSVAALIIGRILGQHEGRVYIGSFIERFYAVQTSLSKMVDEFSEKPPAALLKNILICYLRLCELSRCWNVLRKFYPLKLRDPVYLNHICDGTTRGLAEQVLHSLGAGPQVEPVPLEDLLAGMCI